MFYLLIGNYDAKSFDNTYEQLLHFIVTFVNTFFFFTLLVALSVMSFSKGDSGVWSNEAYLDKAALIGLYSYLLTDAPIRDASKNYLLVATVTEGRKGTRKNIDGEQTQIGGTDPRAQQAKMMKDIERKINSLSSKVDRSLREIKDKVGAAGGRP